MDVVVEGLGKVGFSLVAVAVFFAVLLTLFFLGGLTRGRFQGPVARVVLLGPAIVLLVIGLIVPAVRTITASFQDKRGQEFVGLSNYEWIVSTPDNLITLRNTVAWIVVVPIVSVAVGLLLALLLDRMRRESIPKSLIFMPMAISFVGAGIIWGLVYEYRAPEQEQVGLLSQFVMWMGVSDPPNWILFKPWNNFLLMIIMIWIQVGFAMVVLSAAIKAIPSDVVEAAELDGATGWKLFSKVTIPMIRTTLIVVFTTIMIATLKVFDIVRTMTGGNYGTDVVANQMFTQAFSQGNTGRGSALAVVLFIGVIPIIVYNVRQLRRERSIR